MPKITYSEQSYECLTDETVLECLTRHGVALSSSCRAGVCQSCMCRATDGTPPADAQAGLKPQLQQQGYFLACICRPSEDLTVTQADDNAMPHVSAKVIDKTLLKPGIIRLRLKPETAFDFRAGQFINLHRNNVLIRSYSIASLPQDGYIELHVEHIQGGKMSSWVHDEIAVGDTLRIDGPHGECFYIDNQPQQNLLLIGTGTGLAPLLGVMHDALANNHSGEIHLYHGSRTSEKLYLTEALTQLAADHSNVFYTPCVSGSDSPEFHAGRANDIALTQHPKLDGWRVYLCGHPEMVNSTKKRAFLAGASFNDIHADPFVFSNS